LILASEKGHIKVVELLIAHGAEIDHLDNDGKSPLFYAAGNGHIKVVELLINHGAKVDQLDNDGTSPLFYAAGNGHIKVVELLIGHGAKVDQLDNDGTSPLLYAAGDGHIKVVELLINHGAKVDHLDNEGYSALIKAAGFGHIKVVELLIDHGAEIDHLDNGGRSALWYAVVQGHVDVVDVLIRSGANVNQVNAEGQSLLGIAINSGLSDLSELLFHNGENGNDIDEVGRSALILASEKGHIKVVELLIAHGAEIDHLDNDGKSPLFYAGRVGVLVGDFLIAHGANVDTVFEMWNQVLIFVKSLILAGADPNVIDHAQWEQYVETIMRPVTLIQEYARSGAIPIGQEVSGISPIQSLIPFAFEAKKSGRDIFAEADVLQFLHDQKWTMSKIKMIKSIIHQLVLLKCTDLSVIYIVAPFLDSSDDDMIRHFEIGLKFLTNSIPDLMSTTGSVHRQSLVEYTGPILNAMIHRASPLGLRPVFVALYTIYRETVKGQLSLKGLRIPEGFDTIIHSFDKGPLGIYTDLESRAMAKLGEVIKKRH